MSVVDLSQIGKGKGLRVIGPLRLRHEFRGCCFGAAIALISIYLEQGALNPKRLTRDLKNSKEQILTAQNLQAKLLGLEGKCSKKVLRHFNHFILTREESGTQLPSEEIQITYELFKRHLQDQINAPIRESLLSELEKGGIPLTKDLYALVLEVSGSYEKSIHPKAHRFHLLQRDILREIVRLYGMKTKEIASHYGDRHQLIETLVSLPEGIYHISFSRHSFVYIKDNPIEGWLWDTVHQFRKVEEDITSKKILAKSIRGWYTAKVNWMVFTKIWKKGEAPC